LDIKIQGRNLEVDQRIRQRITQKLDQINRHLPGITYAMVELKSEFTRSQQDRIVAEVTLEVGGSILRAEQRAPNTDAAINSAVEALDRRIERYKSQAYRSERAKHNIPLRTRQAEELAQPQAAPEGEIMPSGNLVRLKWFHMKPMTVEEAAFQMRLLGHSFYMFRNSESDEYNVIYLREDGNYGLIQPMIE
jgi:putative sigma-54 modulation protein